MDKKILSYQVDKKNLSYQERREFFDNKLYKEFCKRGCKILFSSNKKNNYLKKIPTILTEYWSGIDYYGYLLLKINEKGCNQIGINVLHDDVINQGGKREIRYIFYAIRLFETKRDYSFPYNFTHITINQTEILQKESSFYNKINTVVNYIYLHNISIPTDEDLNNYRNNLYPCIYENCFGSKIVYYKWITDTYIYPEIKKIILDIMLRIDNWHTLNFYCMIKIVNNS